MKVLPLILVAGLLAACSPPSDEANGPTAAKPAPASTPAATGAESDSTIASANGVVESVDAEAKTITIAHGPVDALKWPAMTMTFQAPDVDLTPIKTGDRVVFEFTFTGSKAKIVKIARKG
jgi:Cu(I)/Ag(I) efflux system protein CusF